MNNRFTRVALLLTLVSAVGAAPAFSMGRSQNDPQGTGSQQDDSQFGTSMESPSPVDTGGAGSTTETGTDTGTTGTTDTGTTDTTDTGTDDLGTPDTTDTTDGTTGTDTGTGGTGGGY